MNENMQFQFDVPRRSPRGPDRESATEDALLARLEASGGTCIDTLWDLAVLYSRTERLDEASDCVRRVFEQSEDPEELGSCFLNLGQLAERKEDFREAVRLYRSALAMEPCSQRTWYLIHRHLGAVLNQLGEYEEAIPILKAAVDIDPEQPEAYLNISLSFLALGERRMAAEGFIAAIQLNAADPDGLRHLEALVEAHPCLLDEVPGIRSRLKACRDAVRFALGRRRA